ncbi:hypothetical protein HY004_03385, partial [Candidatus Saccharibacteria bacterium]|nr:hypothetical protein [Candidatus Saccharibacteria bacterium]
MYEDDGKKYYSIVMIEPDEELTAELADFFKNLPSIKFIAMRNLAGGLAMTDCRKADLIITELEFTGLDNVKDQLANQGWA